MDIMNRKETIMKWINARERDNEKPMPCIFYITVPRFLEGTLSDDENIKEILNILDKYNIEWMNVDTISGAYNLNRDWIETEDIPCYIEYCGVYPTKWDIEDIVKLESLEYEGKIMINVLWHPEEDKYIPNH